MSGLYFNSHGETHSLRLRIVDNCDDGIAVWEALVDGGSSFFFESPENSEIWTLFHEAVGRYIEYRGTNEMVVTNWEVQ
jgi:hypothetical protein